MSIEMLVALLNFKSRRDFLGILAVWLLLGLGAGCYFRWYQSHRFHCAFRYHNRSGVCEIRDLCAYVIMPYLVLPALLLAWPATYINVYMLVLYLSL